MSRNHLLRLCFLVPLAFSLWVNTAAADHIPDHIEGYESFKKGAYAEAFQMWEKLANEGSVNAEYNLGMLYSLGKGVKEDHQKAFEWFHRAARRGLAPAQIRIATMYATGTGVELNAVDAYMWLLIWERSHSKEKSQEAEIFHKQMMELMAYIGLSMAEEDKNTAKRRARKWIPAR